MRKILFGVVITLVILFTLKYCDDQSKKKTTLTEQTAILQEQIKNVGKLVVTEGYFSEVFTYKNSKAIFGDWLEATKQAIVIVNANVTVAYDLSEISYDINSETKTLRITSIPKEELKIYPNLEYYDIQADYLNQFEAKDYNAIKQQVADALKEKIEASNLKRNAQNRLLSELSKFYILTNSMGWTLEYNDNPISNYTQLKHINL